VSRINEGLRHGKRPARRLHYADRCRNTRNQYARPTPLCWISSRASSIRSRRSFGAKSTHTVGRSHSNAGRKGLHPSHRRDQFRPRPRRRRPRPGDLGTADVILVGVSRSGKTPTSLYLSLQFGIRAANCPLIPETSTRMSLPTALQSYRGKLFGLSIAPERAARDPQRAPAQQQVRRPGELPLRSAAGGKTDVARRHTLGRTPRRNPSGNRHDHHAGVQAGTQGLLAAASLAILLEEADRHRRGDVERLGRTGHRDAYAVRGEVTGPLGQSSTLVPEQPRRPVPLGRRRRASLRRAVPWQPPSRGMNARLHRPSTPSKIERKKCAPIPARMDLRRPGEDRGLPTGQTCGTPAATAVRKIDPRFPGSWMFSRSRQSETLCGTGPGSGVLMTRGHPGRAHELGDAVEKAVREREARTRRNVFEKPADLRIGKERFRWRGSSRLTRRSPDTHAPDALAIPEERGVPVPARSRDDPASLIRALTCGLSLDWMDVTRCRRWRNPAKTSPRSEYRKSARYWRSAARASPRFSGAILCGFRTMSRNTRDTDRIRTRIGAKGAGGPFPDVAEHLPAAWPRCLLPRIRPRERDPIRPDWPL